MRKIVFVAMLCFSSVRLSAQQPYVSSFVDSLSLPVLYNPLKIDTIINESAFAHVSWYSQVVQLEKSRNFSEAYKVIESKKDEDQLAMYLMGKYFYLGLNNIVDKSSAFMWFFNATRGRSPLASEAMGIMYFLGEGCEKNEAIALEHFHKALEGGLNSPNGKIGYIYHRQQNLDSALYWYKRALLVRDPYSAHNIATIYETRNETENILANYMEGAKNELVLSNRRLGEIYLKGLFNVKPDIDRARVFLEKACNANDAESCNDLGLVFIAQKNQEKAYESFAKGNYGNDKYSTYNLAVCLSEGIGMKPDVQQAFNLYSKVSDEIVEAQNNIGTLYERNLLVKASPNDARNWYEKAAGNHNIPAMINLGNVLLTEGEKSEPKAEQWLKKAASTGDLNGIYHYTRLIRNKKEKVEKVMEWAEKLANNDTDGTLKKWGLSLIGDLYRQKADNYMKRNESLKEGDNAKLLNENLAAFQYKKAMDNYQKAARLNDDSSMVKLGQLYYKGNAVKKDISLALELWQKAASLGNATAMYNLAYLYEKEDSQYPQRARYDYVIRYYKEAITAPKVSDGLKKDAAFRLGNFYQYPESKAFEKNTTEAMRWYELAAGLGDADAMYEIGYIYEYGGATADRVDARIKADKEEALKWYKKALGFVPDHADSQKALKRLERVSHTF